MTSGGSAGPGADTDDRLHSLYAATRELMTATDRESLASVVVDVCERVLGFPLAGVHLRSTCDSEGLEPVAYPDPVRERFDGDPPTYTPEDRVYEVYDAEDTLRLGPTAARPDEPHRGVVVPIPGHGVLIAGAEETDPADEATTESTFELVELLGENTAVALDRLEREARLNELHETTRELMEARDDAAVAAAATNTAHEVLDLRLNAVYLRSTDADRLVPVSVTGEVRELFGEVPSLTRDSIGWYVYETGEPTCHEDVRESPRVANAGTPIRSGMAIPLGDHGVFFAASERVGRFDETDLALAQLFADTVEAALDRAEREALVRRRERELARQNERLDEFASVVSHDLRNPLNVAQGRLELLGDDCDSPHLDHMETAHERMEALIDDLLTLARTGRSVGDTEEVAVARSVRTVWRTIDGGGSLRVADDAGSVEADASRLQELFENLFRNAVDHVGDDVVVTVGRIDDPGRTGFFVADDGRGIPPAERDEVFDRGHTTAEDGTGFGLAIVADIAAAHGWDVRATDAAPHNGGGARFEVVTCEADR
ncbi:GAF domain-containing sensor histidine kinase [Halobaculum lipolyticum]|uniref:histidine kinase n=1 Tax=Halobaculum lipolyticum TaxID=3032001 RepID=A0ABD5WC04_9EURY|nr:GAF domain-containing sensor histidine kinase [Halobaculum sp. DT31]